MCDPILKTLMKMKPHHSQSSCENATLSSGTSPLGYYWEVPPPPGVNTMVEWRGAGNGLWELLLFSFPWSPQLRNLSIMWELKLPLPPPSLGWMTWINESSLPANLTQGCRVEKNEVPFTFPNLLWLVYTQVNILLKARTNQKGTSLSEVQTMLLGQNFK